MIFAILKVQIKILKIFFKFKPIFSKIKLDTVKGNENNQGFTLIYLALF